MSSFKARVVRERGADGRLSRAGFEWNESRPNLEFNSIVVAMFGGAGLYLSMALSSLPRADLSGFATGSAIVAAAGFGMAFLIPRRPRAIIFHADGGIGAPYGLPWYPFHLKVHANHSSVMSIEQRDVPNELCRVRLITTGGDVVYVSRNLSDAESLKVAVQLTAALTELRQEQASGGQPVGPANPPLRPLAQLQPVVD